MTYAQDLLDDLLARRSLGAQFAQALWERDGFPGPGRSGTPDKGRQAEHSGVLEVRAVIDTSSSWATTASPKKSTAPVLAPRVGDLFTRVPVEESQIRYAREINFVDDGGGASAVAEAGEKPEQTFRFEGDVADVKKFAAIGRTSSDVLEDIPGLEDYVDRRMIDRLRIREADQLLNGDGTNENILGLRNVSGVQTQTFATSVTETVARAIEKVELVDGVVDGVAIHPSSYRSAILAAPDYWHDIKTELRVIRTRDVGTNKAVVGAFGTAAVIRERSTTVKLTDSHSTDFIANKIAIAAERREMLVVNVPSWFVDAALA